MRWGGWWLTLCAADEKKAEVSDEFSAKRQYVETNRTLFGREFALFHLDTSSGGSGLGSLEAANCGSLGIVDVEYGQ